MKKMGAGTDRTHGLEYNTGSVLSKTTIVASADGFPAALRLLIIAIEVNT